MTSEDEEEQRNSALDAPLSRDFNAAKEISEYRLAVQKLNKQKAATMLSDLHFNFS